MLQTGTRQQLSNVTSFIDASDLYGSNDVTNANLRTKVDGIYSCFSSPVDLKPHYIFNFFSSITWSISKKLGTEKIFLRTAMLNILYDRKIILLQKGLNVNFY